MTSQKQGCKMTSVALNIFTQMRRCHVMTTSTAETFLPTLLQVISTW